MTTQKWEYIELRVFGPDWADSRGNAGRLVSLPIKQGGAAQWRWTSPVLNELGEEGWELVGMADDASPNAYTAFFKRPKS